MSSKVSHHGSSIIGFEYHSLGSFTSRYKNARIYIAEASMHTIYSYRSRRCSKYRLFPPLAWLLYFLSPDVRFACSTPFLVNDQAQGQVDSLIPLLFSHYNDAQYAIDISIALLETAVSGFDQAAYALLISYIQDERVVTRLDSFVDGCRYACTANPKWR